MDEKKIRLSTVVLISIIVVLVLTIGGLCWHISSIKNKNAGNAILAEDTSMTDSDAANDGQNSEENPATISTTEDNETSLSDAEKISANEKLLDDGLLYAISDLISVPTSGEETNIVYDTNLLSSAKNRYYFVWELMHHDPAIRGREGLTIFPVIDYSEFGEMVATGASFIHVDSIKQYHKKIFGTDIDEATFLSRDELLANGYIHGSHATGLEPEHFLFKANSLELDEKTGVYTLTVDCLPAFITVNNGFYDELKSPDYAGADVLTWDSSLNSEKLKIGYTKDADGNYTLVSLIFVK